MVSFYQAEKKSNLSKAIEVTCSALDIQGRGICKHEGMVYFVPNLMLGEKARIVPASANAAANTGTLSNAASAAGASAKASALASKASAVVPKDKFAPAKVTKLLTVSPQRLTPTCPLHEQCGGCPLDHLPEAMALDAKIKGIAQLFTKVIVQGTKAALTPTSSKAVASSRFNSKSTIKQALAHKQAQAKQKARQQEIAKATAAASALMQQPNFVLHGESTGYRRACRLALRADHGKLYLGFRAAQSNELVPLTHCEVLTERNNALLAPLTSLVNTLSCKKSIGHVELLDTDGLVGVLFRLTCHLEQVDELKLQDFAQQHQVVISVLEPFKQLDDTEVVRERIIATPENPLSAVAAPAVSSAPAASPDAGSEDSAASTEDSAAGSTKNAADAGKSAAGAGKSAASSALFVHSHDCTVYCSPSSFVQVNSAMNQALLAQVLSEVAPHPEQKVLDLFSGLGNFALPIAKAGASVVGIDIVSDMVQRAQENAQDNGLSPEQARFYMANLEEPFESQMWAKEHYDVVVMDPGRMGAKRAVTYMDKLQPNKIIMISCNPLAASRDCSQLLASHYKITSWGVVDMFPRTAHVEMVLVFTRA